MIRMPAAIVPHNGPNVFRHRFKITDQILDRLLFQISVAFDRVV